MSTSDRSGQTLAGRFALERAVAAGGMGRIYRARDLAAAGAKVAVKVMSQHADAAGLVRFELECEALARIDHPNVVRYVAHGRSEDNGDPWLAMEWLEGHDLAHALDHMRERRVHTTVVLDARRRDDGEAGASAGEATGAAAADADADADVDLAMPAHMSCEEVVTLGRELASALGALHRAGIVHRDLKPSNVFLVGGDVAHAKLIDLGIARVDARRSVTQTGMLVGTPFYMAPEQARGDAVLGPAVDVFALGSVLYECLVGQSPFHSDGVASTLVRIMFLDPTPIEERRGDLPAALAAAIGAMLQKPLGARPADGAAALALLERVPRALEDDAPRTREAPPAHEITHTERRTLCTLLVREPAPGEPDALHVRAAEWAAWIDQTGTRATPLVDGSVVVVAEGAATPSEAAARLARAGLTLLERAPDLALSLRVEQVAGDTVTTGAPARNTSSVPGALRVDAGTAALIEARFELARGADGAIAVVRERPREAVRTLLGRPTRTVGRKRDLALIEATLEEVESERIARAVLVLAPAGVGKTRLVHELLQTPRDAEVLIAQGDPIGATWSLVASLLRRAAGLGLGADAHASGDDDRARLGALLARTLDAAALERHLPFVGLVAGVAIDVASERMRAARSDPTLLAEAAREAFCAWLASLRRPILLVLEDLHWADLASLRLVESALTELAHGPLCVLALARPEVKTRFPALFSGRPLTEHTLDALPPRASAELVRQCLPAASDEVVDALVARAAGHAFYLEELIRAVASGEAAHTALPDSVLAMVQARLDAIGLEHRRVLRAASVFGMAFVEPAVAHVLGGASTAGGDARTSDRLARWLDELTARELITAAAPVQGQRAWSFRHALVRDAAHATLTDADRANAHRRAGLWLESSGSGDAAALAHHFRAGGDVARAVHWLARAAEEALEGDDLAGAVQHGEAAEALGGAGIDLGRALAARATAHRWASAHARAVADGERALAVLPAGSARWFQVAGHAAVAAARMIDDARVRALTDLARDTPPLDAEAEAERLVCIARQAFQMTSAAGRFPEVDAVVALLPPLDRLEDDPRLEARIKAQIFDLYTVRANFRGELATQLKTAEATLRWYERAGDARNVMLAQAMRGFAAAELNGAATMLAIIRENLARAIALKAQAPATLLRMILGMLLSASPEPAHHAEARSLLEALLAEAIATKNARIVPWVRGLVAELYYRSGELARAEAELVLAEEALASLNVVLHTWVTAALARTTLALEAAGARPERDALALARRALAALERLGGLSEGDMLVPLVAVRCLSARGLDDEAREVAAMAIARVKRRADELPPEWRARYLAHPWAVETLALSP